MDCKKAAEKIAKLSKLFRTTGKFSTDFEPLRNKFIRYIFLLLRRGALHRKIDGEELNIYLTRYFGGFPLLKRHLKTILSKQG